MRIVKSKMRQILHPVVICLAMLTIIAPINVPTSRTVSARTQKPAYVKTGAVVNLETMLSRIFPLYNVDSLLNGGRNGLGVRYSLLNPGLSNKLILPTQEQGKTSVPFKGLTKEGMAKEGTVSLVLRIYDQANGGTKLYEATHEVEVTMGQYFAVIQVPTETIVKSETIWLEAASVEETGLAMEPRTQFTPSWNGPSWNGPDWNGPSWHGPDWNGPTWNGPTWNGPDWNGPDWNGPSGAITGVGLCRTCGSFRWVGAIPVPSGRKPIEYGFNCGAPLAPRDDSIPYLCSIGN
jgi:hypothetical protein